MPRKSDPPANLKKASKSSVADALLFLRDEPADCVLELERVFPVPRGLLWSAWTDPQHLQNWMGPSGFTTSFFEHDLRPGGKWQRCLKRLQPGGGCGDVAELALWQSGVYQQIIPQQLLSFTFGWDGRLDIPRHDTIVTITFEEEHGMTTMRFHQEFFTSREDRDGHSFGWRSTFERLQKHLSAIS